MALTALKPALEVQHLGIRIAHHGRDNVGGVVVGDASMRLGDWKITRPHQFCRSFVAEAGLDFTTEGYVYERHDLRCHLYNWASKDTHHEKDQAYNLDFTSLVANTKIAARNRQSHSKED
jgi:hypothetical protein